MMDGGISSPRVPAPAQLGHGHLADGGRGGGRRARNCRENAAANHVAMHQPSGQCGEPGRESAEHILGDAAAEQDFAHPDEKRQGRKRPAGARSPDRRGHKRTRRRIGEGEHGDEAHAQQCDRDPYAANEEERQHGKQDQRGGPEFHAIARKRAASKLRRRRWLPARKTACRRQGSRPGRPRRR